MRWGYRTDGLNPGRTVGQCVQMRWGHRTDGLSSGRTVGLSAGVVGQFVIKRYSREFITFYSLNSFSFNFDPAVCSLIPSKINSYLLRLCPFKLEVVLVIPNHRAANLLPVVGVSSSVISPVSPVPSGKLTIGVFAC